MMPKTQRDYVAKAHTAAVMIYRKGLAHAGSHFCHTVIQQNKQISLYLKVGTLSALTEIVGLIILISGFLFGRVEWKKNKRKKE